MAKKRSKRYREARVRRRHAKRMRWMDANGLLLKTRSYYTGENDFIEFSGFNPFDHLPKRT